MASTYLRDNSPFIWLKYKGDSGKWSGKATSYRQDNIGDRRQAELLARKQSIIERESAPASAGEHWDGWVDSWLRDRYGNQSATLKIYQRYWRKIREWLKAERINSPAQLTYPRALEYKTARTHDGLAINSVIHELKFLGVIMGEAIRRGFAKSNPCHKMGIHRDAAKTKIPWTDAQATTVADAVIKRCDWMQATFILGFYQAARLRQCEVPLSDIQLPRMRITYWRSLTGRTLTKGDKPFTQPIATAALPMLEALIQRRRQGGFASLCEIPHAPSVDWREFLDSLGFHDLVHHGLRTTWITRAAQSGQISRAQAMRFVNHGSTAVHEIYQRLNADDVAHVADALNLPALAPSAAH